MSFIGIRGNSDTALIQDNIGASVDPTATDDNTKGYSPRSMWINASSGVVFQCASSATGSAVWPKIASRLPDLQLFIGAGSYTYNLPPNAKYVRIRGLAPGGAGGSGFFGNSALASYSGGGGGQSGSAIDAIYPVQAFTSGVTAFAFTLPSFGVGGAAQMTVNTAGIAGTAGGDVNINVSGLKLYAAGGQGGLGGVLNGTALGGLLAGVSSFLGAAGGNGTIGVGGAGVGPAGNSGGGAGGGGGVMLGTPAAGGAGGPGTPPYGAPVGGTAGAVNTAGGNGTSVSTSAPGGGAGGGGGGASSTGAGKAGGNGGNYGAAGGGGGASSSGTGGSGKGGDGAPGILVFTTLG